MRRCGIIKSRLIASFVSISVVSMESTAALKLLDPRGYHKEFINNGIRSDGRVFTDLRRLTVSSKGNSDSSTPISLTTCGESLVHIGATVVACTISIMVGTPSPKYPDLGDIEFDVSLWPICSLKHEQRSNKPEEAYILESFLADVFVNSEVLDMTQLSIEKGRWAYRLSVRLVCISDDGNLADAAVLATTRALMGSLLPRPVVNAATVSIACDGATPLILTRTPISVTCGVFNAAGSSGLTSSSSSSRHDSGGSGSNSGGDVLLADLTQDEEAVVRGTVTCVVDTNQDTSSLCLLLQVPL